METTREPRYDGEDISPTTNRELRGFYAYSIAAEVYAICAVGSFLPVTLEQLARERGVLWSDRSTPCTAKAAVDNGAAAVVSLLSRAASEPQNDQCIVDVLGAEITTSSFAMYTFSLAVFIQAVTLISFSSLADHANYRKKLLVAFAFVGAVSCMLFFVIVPEIFLVGSLLVIIGVTCLGSSFVLLNSYLPLLVANHSAAQKTNESHLEDESSIRLVRVPSGNLENTADEDDGHEIMPTTQQTELKQADSPELKLSAQISSKGIGIGYAAAVLAQILSILILYFLSKTSVSSTLPLRIVLFVVGVWWLLFTIATLLCLRSRPGPPLAPTKSNLSLLRSSLDSISFAWKSLFRTISIAIRLRQMLVFLIAWFLLSDAVATVSGTAMLFARTELGLSTVSIAVLSITATSSGIAGAFLWPIISRRFALRTNHTIVACILLMEVVPLYGLLGYLPFIRSLGVGGLQQPWEIFPLGVVHGFVMGGISSYCRSFFGILIPPGSEAAFYALFAITDKGSSVVGPAVVGRIVDATGSIRPAFGFLAVLILLPIPMVWWIDGDRGREDAIRMSRVIRKVGDVNVESEHGVNTQVEYSIDEGERLMRDHD